MPTPTPTPTQAPRFSFAAPFSFETAIGVEGTEFTGQGSLNNGLLIAMIETRFLSPDRSARMSFTPQGDDVTIEFRYDDVALSAAGPAGSNFDYRFVGRDVDQENVVIGPLSSSGNTPSGGSAEVTVVHYRAQRIARTFETATGTAQRQVFAIIGNPATEFGRISRSKDYQTFGRFTGSLGMANRFTLSADYNSNIDALATLSRLSSSGLPELQVNVILQGSHDPVTNRVSGRVRSSQQGEIIGTFEGALYGPSRNHVGMVFDIMLPQTGQRHIGWVFGSGQDVM